MLYFELEDFISQNYGTYFSCSSILLHSSLTCSQIGMSLYNAKVDFKNAKVESKQYAVKNFIPTFGVLLGNLTPALTINLSQLQIQELFFFAGTIIFSCCYCFSFRMEDQ